MFSAADVSQLVGSETFARGEEYVSAGQVVSVARNGDGTTIVGQVRGSARKQYVTVVEMSSAGEQATPRYGRCSCPVRLNCKHTAATLLAYLDRLTAQAILADAAAGVAADTAGERADSGAAAGILPGTDSARGAAGSPGHAAQTASPATGRTTPRRSAEWERTFATLLTEPDDTPPVPGRPGRKPKPWDLRSSHDVALQVELLTEPTGRSSRRALASVDSPRLGMRPVTRSATGRWVRTGISWSELRFLNYRHGAYPDGHVDILRSLFGLAISVSDSAYFSAPTWVYADELPSAALWALLTEARRSGLPMVHSDKAQSPVVLAGPARTRLTVSRGTAGLVLGAAIEADTTSLDPASRADGPTGASVDLAGAGELAQTDAAGQDTLDLADATQQTAGTAASAAEAAGTPHGLTPLDRATTSLLGEPPTGLVTWRGRRAPTKETRVVLAPLASPVDPPVLALLERPEPLTVPETDQRRFLLRVLPALEDRFDAVDLDPSITLPERPRPTLHLDVLHLPEHGLRLTWQWRYAVEDDDGTTHTLRFDLGPSTRQTDAGVRDPRAETQLLDRLAGRAPRLPGAAAEPRRAADDTARLADVAAAAVARVGRTELADVATALFVTDQLPLLLDLAQEETDLVVEVRGEAVDYRRADDVEISVSTSTLPETRDWFDLAVIVTAGQQFIPFADVFTALAKGKSSLLLVDGLHFSLDDERFHALRELIEEARAMQDTMGGTLRVNRFQAGLFDELERLGVVGGQAQAWREAVGALAGGARPGPVPAPAGLDATMREYQQEGFEWLAFLHEHGLGGVLADDMGLGKTLQALALVQHVREAATASETVATSPGPDASDRPEVVGADDATGTGNVAQTRSTAPFLVVAPTSVVGNWAAEVRRFTPGLKAVTVTETLARRRTPLSEVVAGADVVVTSYALFRLGFEEYRTQAWAGLILDEAQFVKNHQSVAYQCARRLDAPFKLALTGTPLENNLMELWSIVSVVSPGLFPTPGRFQDYYAKPIEKEGYVSRLDQLRRRIAPFMLRRTKEDVAKDLPEKQEQVVDVVLNSRHRALYDAYLQRERTKVLGLVDEFGEHRFEVFRSLTVLRQASLDVSLVDSEHEKVPSSKLEVLYEMLDDILAEGHSVLIFSQFTQFLGRVRDHLDRKDVDYSYLDGRTRRRTETIERFTSGETSVFLISLKAGGFGLNLTAADYCILLDPWWNPAAEAQAVDRAHRIGQTRNVNVYRMVSTDTIEEKVMALKASKSKLFASVLDGGAAGGAGLTATDVRELLG
ncbi:DEAD/DEAH box helicase [Sanguibacter inulinus]|uniref:DEAD/DEAH box helicase n=1 Tax=Sanguibacter inulinus TaxID=60922 RepID=A0A853ETJ9_9MICO|nr:DEAD/DEAH box helicase [Sanguibacter inulinus]MBF0721073.1 DEAD/DEAH box helicase [Sanguibacter inulinus]NYS92218.1 DEAD/DEAH box helicase [Sanguibacter inulinus]